MNDRIRHKIYNHLDDPVRFLIWTIPEAMVLIVPFFIGTSLGYYKMGMLFCVLGFWSMRKWQQVFGTQSIRGFLFWYLPYNKKLYKTVPPSFIREYVG